MKKLSSILPLALVLALLFFFSKGLTLDPKALNSPLVNKKAPSFSITTLDKPEILVNEQIFLDRVTVLKAWSSGCWACQQEHDFLSQTAKKLPELQWLGLNYKDERLEAKNWLKAWGDPYQYHLYDLQGRMGLDYGVYGTPETFIIDKKGWLRYKAVGAITEEKWRQEIEPLIIDLMEETP